VVEQYVFPQRENIETIAAAVAFALNKKESYYSFGISSETKKYPSGDLCLKTSTLTIADTCSGDVWKGNAVVFSMGGLDDVCRLSKKTTQQMRKFANIFTPQIF
jgi:hypothetical protein